MKKKATWRDKLKHWFDEQMSQGSLGLIKLLTITTVLTALTVAVIMQAAGILVSGEYGTFGARLWASFSSIINCFLPYYGDGDIKYRSLVAFNTVYSLFVTSMRRVPKKHGMSELLILRIYPKSRLKSAVNQIFKV